jgi:uncharacterized DUF497 family protein
MIESLTSRPHVEGLHWDDWNRAHIAKHDVLPEEAEEVVANVPVVRDTSKQRLLFIGPTLAGRMLAVVAGAVPHRPGIYYVFSARPASRQERRLYSQARGSSIP